MKHDFGGGSWQVRSCDGGFLHLGRTLNGLITLAHQMVMARLRWSIEVSIASIGCVIVAFVRQKHGPTSDKWLRGYCFSRRKNVWQQLYTLENLNDMTCL